MNKVDPYVDGAYYAGYRVGELEIGPDPSALAQGFTAPSLRMGHR